MVLGVSTGVSLEGGLFTLETLVSTVLSPRVFLLDLFPPHPIFPPEGLRRNRDPFHSTPVVSGLPVETLVRESGDE